MTKATVMVVDDDQDIREILTEVLSDAGYDVVPSTDGSDALTKLRDATPSLILLDLNMPIMDGVEFRQMQRKDPAKAKIPTVVMSAVHGMNERIANLAVDGALAKPVNLKDLMQVVERYCAKR
jgi:CheY-like chemotaxis protein